MPCAWSFSIILILLDVSRKYLFSWNKTRITLFVHQKGKTRITIQKVWLQIYAMLSSSLCLQDSCSIIPFKFSSNVCYRTVSIQTTLYNRKFSSVTFLGVELMSKGLKSFVSFLTKLINALCFSLQMYSDAISVLFSR